MTTTIMVRVFSTSTTTTATTTATTAVTTGVRVTFTTDEVGFGPERPPALSS